MSVEISELTKIYGEQKALDSVSFTVQKGEILGFLGPNGAGKSTTMKITTGYVPPTFGKVSVEGVSVMDNPLKVKKIIGYLPEHNPLYLEMYVHEYLRFIGSLYGLRGKSLMARVREMVELCGLTLEQRKKIGALSKGYRQRVGLAQALIHDPSVLILDEPTTGLDPNQIVDIRELIRQIGANKTVIFSTHILQEVQAICDRVVIINQGEIVADKSVGELLKDHSGQVVEVEFEEKPEQVILEKIEGVTEVNDLGQNKFRIRSEKETDLRSRLFKVASEKGYTLIGMNQAEDSMEDIFRKLTKDK